jgi:glucose/arabinose dehydrogenase
MRKLFFLPALLIFTTLCFSQSSIVIGSTTIQVDTLVEGIDIPWEIQWGPDNHIWMTERRGRISRINPTNGQVSVILDHQNLVWEQSEAGMLGFLLHPEFDVTPYVFVVYTYGTSNNPREKLARFTFENNQLVDELTLLDNIPGNSTHVGSRLTFLADGTILMTTGDAQNQPSAQDLNTLTGKILRLNQDGSIPSDNPFGPNSFVYALGLRNTQGLYQLSDGRIFISEHGPNTDDEFMELLSGRNYGWPNVQGFCDTPTEQTFCNANNVVEPLVAWTPTIAPSDLIYYQNENFPEWNNKFLMTVLKNRMLVALDLNADMTAVNGQTEYLNDLFGRLRDICVGPNNEIYLATNGLFWSNSQPNTHTIVKLTPPGSNVGIEPNNIASWHIYPNPTSGKIQISGSFKKDLKTIELVNASGQIVSKIVQNDFSEILIDENIDAGFYFIRLIGNNFVTQFPLQVQ